MVTLIVNNCVPFLQKSNQIPPSKGKPMHSELLSYPMQRVYMSIMKHIFTILDGFTRYLTAIPIPDLESSTLLNTFVEEFA